MSLEELLAYVAAIAGTAIAVLIVFYATRRKKTIEEEVLPPSPKLEASQRWHLRAQRSISVKDAKAAGEELRTLSLEREILSDAIRRLYEAHAEGIITEEERENLAKLYKSRMMKVRDAITSSESVVALHELEVMQEDLTKLFNERFDDLNAKIEALRSKVGAETKETIVPTPIPELPQIEARKTEASSARKKNRRAQAKPPKSRKTAAEERIEKIRSEVEKVLDRLEQMEAEA